MSNLLNGLLIYVARETGAFYIPLPREQWGQSAWTDGGKCFCGKCDGSGLWDTLVVPGKNDKQSHTFTIHCPELQTGNIPEWLMRR